MSRICIGLLAAMMLASCATIGSPFVAWKNRLFGTPDPAIVNAPLNGVVPLEPGHPIRLMIDAVAPKRDFPEGESHYRIVELPEKFDYASLTVRVLARPSSEGRGNSVFRPIAYVLDDADKVSKTVQIKPLHLDIRPLKRTRLLACVKLKDVQRIALATPPKSIGKSYESEVRDSVKAPTKGGFYYRTDAVKVRLPYAAVGELVIEIHKQPDGESGC